jgi:hypothetical protein
VFVDDNAETADMVGPGGFFECTGAVPQGTLVGAWAPGSIPLQTPPDVGMRVPAGARIVLNVHYHPTGLGPEIDDATSLEIAWLDHTPTFRGEMALVGNAENPDILLPNPGDAGDTPEFRIPAGASNHIEEMVFEVPDSVPLAVRVWAVGTHMHYVGVDMLMRVERNGSPDTCMLQTPYYDFNWQRSYRYDAELDAMPTVTAGERIYLRCTYDNSMGNPRVVRALAEQGLDAPVDVYLGEETLDEMCLGVFALAIPSVF